MTAKLPEILQSANNNDGERAVLKTMLAPGATVFPHFHTLFNETLEILEGEIDVWNEESKITLMVGQPATIEKNAIHSFQGAAKET